MIGIAWTLGSVAAWLFLSVLIDRSNARNEKVSAVSLPEIAVVLAVTVVGTLLAPAPQRLGVGVALAGLGIAAAGDLRHGYLWEEISVPTLFAVLAAGAFAGETRDEAAGAAVMGALALLVYFGGRLVRKETGFGDVIPIAIVGAALGAVTALASFAVACVLFAVVALALGKRFGTALPFGPAIAAALFIGAAGSAWLPAVGWR